MDEKAKSPFARLDTSLLRSTRATPPAEPPEAPPLATEATSLKTTPRKRVPRQQASTPAQELDHKQASEIASTLASKSDEIVAAIRKVVRTPGREVSFVRLTPAEKAELAEVVYTYKRRGYRTTENEVNRIAVNFILEDHRRNAGDSILTRVLDALLA